MENENMVIILGRKQLGFIAKNKNIPMEEITAEVFWPTLNQVIANAEVVLFKEGKEFKVLKHDYMPDAIGQVYHMSDLKNITFAKGAEGGS